MGTTSLFSGYGIRRSLLLVVSFVGLMGALLLRPGLWDKPEAPAQIANAYFTENLSSAKTLLFPTNQSNLYEVTPQGEGYFVMDVAMNVQGLHNLDVEVRNQRGEKLNTLAYEAVPSVQDGFIHTIVGKIGQKEGARTVHLYDRLVGGERTPIGVFNILTPKGANGEAQPALSVKRLSPDALQEAAAVLRSIDAAQLRAEQKANGKDETHFASAMLHSALRLVEQITGLDNAIAGAYEGEDTLCWLPVSPALANSDNVKMRFPHFNIPLKLDDRTFRLDGVGPYTSWLQARMAARQLTPGGQSQVLCIHGDGQFEIPQRGATGASMVRDGQGSYWYLIAATASARQLSRIQGVLDTIGTPFKVYEVPVSDKRAAFVLMGPFGAQQQAREQVQVAREHLGSTGIWLHGAAAPAAMAKQSLPPDAASPAVTEDKRQPVQPKSLATGDPMAKFMALLGHYRDVETAKRLVADLRGRGIPARLRHDAQVDGPLYQVYTGPYASWLDARMGLRQARYRMGLEGGEVTQWKRLEGVSKGRVEQVAQDAAELEELVVAQQSGG
ncbi:Sporulation domain protein [Magnetococcus marinus MC-1]|uniref:Sporulation domain protein n=1 Tax=Magnetococcus marinus (strain ATCC BAA-1437 / JCM 17883 / MC-1) TaxID=156889 RepID=A0L648_MAGMM|nr:SPOR domain-containing protein [Magnetococcus marinus]ABK43441.1 Sporulation domain protein [Magnetococcus marinus MC-1]